jgi:redox-sensitive bicupin YhaK (pirin superfamily)
VSTVDTDLDAGPAAAAPAGTGPAPAAPTGTGTAAAGAGEVTAARLARVGDIEVRRLLPLRHRRSVGGWCFADHYGPMSVDGVAGMDVPPHPHIGLQTVTWLIEGNVLHRDSLGSEQMIRPGQLNLMTAGGGIAHSEESPAGHDPGLHGVQLWLALPGAHRGTAPAFEHHSRLPVTGFGGLEVRVFAGSLAGVASPARVFSPVVGAEISARGDTRGTVPLAPAHEHVLFAACETAFAAGTSLAPGRLLYLATGQESVTVSARAGARLFLLGGQPLGEPLLMWWNFVGRTPQDIIEAAADWQRGSRFGDVRGYRGARLPAPPVDAVRLARRAR